MFGLDAGRLWENGILGTAVFCFGWALGLIPLAVIAYSAYLASAVGEKYWITVVGSGPLACAILVIAASILQLILHFFYQFGLFAKSQDYLKVGRAAAFFVVFLLLSISLKFYAPSEIERNAIEFREYSKAHAETDPQADEYAVLMEDAAGNFTIQELIWARSIAPRIPILAFSVAWLGCFALHLFAVNLIETKGVQQADDEPLQRQHEPR
jgi:hypothetical protein